LPIFIRKDGKKVLPRTFYIKILIFCGLIVVSAVLMQPLQAALKRMMYQIHTDLIENLEKYTGLAVSYSSIRPAFLGSFDVRYLRFQKGEEPFFNTTRIRFSFSLKELLFNRKLLIHTVQIEKPVINIDTQRDKETIDILAALFRNRDENESFGQISNYLPKQADYQINNGIFLFSDRSMVCRLTDIELNIHRGDFDSVFNINNKNDDFIINGKSSVSLSYSGVFNRTIIVAAGIGINGMCSNDLQTAQAGIAFSHMTISQQAGILNEAASSRTSANTEGQERLLTVHPFSTAVSYKDKTLNVNPLQTVNDNYYSFSYNMSEREVLAQINLNDFRPDAKAVFSGFWSNISHLFSLQITGSSSLRFSGADMEYSVNLRGGKMSGYTALNPAHDLAGYQLTDAFIVNASGNEKTVTVSDLIISSSALASASSLFNGIISYSGIVDISPLSVNGELILDRFSMTGDDYIGAVFSVTGNNGEILISSEEIKISQTQIKNMNIVLSPDKNDIGISVSCLCGSENSGAVFIDGAYFMNLNQIEASLSLNDMSVYELTEIIRPFFSFFSFPAISRNYLHASKINTEVFFSTDFNNIVYNVPSLVFDSEYINGIISLSGTGRQLAISEGIVNFFNTELLASARMNFSNPMDIDFNISADFLDLSWRLDGQINDRRTLIIHDPNGFNLYGTLSDTGAVSGYMEIIDFPVPVNTQTVYLSFFSSLRYESMDLWNLEINQFEALYNGGNHFSVSGIADQSGARFRNLSYSDSAGNLSGAADFFWEKDFSYIEVHANATDGKDAGENYYLECVYNRNHAELRASVSHMQINRFFRERAPMSASGKITINWDSISSFIVLADITSFYTFINNTSVNGSVSINLNNDELLVSSLILNYASIQAEIPELQINRVSGIVKTNAAVQGIDRFNITGNLALDARFNPIDSWMDYKKAYDKFSGTLTLQNLHYNDMKNDGMAFVFSRNEGSLFVSGGTKNMLRLEVDSDGYFFAGLSSPSPIQGTVIGTIKNGILDAQFNNFFLDLVSIWAFVPDMKEFSIVGGYITGQMDLRGHVLSPEFYGTARASSIRLQVPEYINADIRSVPFNINAEGYDVTFGPVVAAAGSGSGTASGWLVFENWIPSSITLDINVPRESPIPYSLDISGFLAKGSASGKFDLTADILNRVMELTGNIFTNDAELGLNVDNFSSISNSIYSTANTQKNNEMNTMLNFTITTGSMVEFVWPASSPILRANPEMGTVVYITADSQNSQFSINSDVRIRSGELFYFERSFYIRQGNIIFRENENQFDPRISARAEIRDRAESGTVTISMIVDNQPLLNFEPRFESSPALTQLEIYSILGQNFGVNQNNEDMDMQRFIFASTTDFLTQIIATSDVLSQFVFFRQFERGVRNLLGLDMFSVRTRFLHNAVLSGVAGLSQAAVDRNYSVGNYFDNTTVFIGKYIGRDMFVQGMLTMRYDKNNVSFGGLVFEPDIGIELQSPFVNIKWSFFPYHPENWWVNDHSFTLSWNFSF